jgi:hypothetical protein
MLYSLLSGNHGRRWQIWICMILAIAALAVSYAIKPSIGRLFDNNSNNSQMRVRQAGHADAGSPNPLQFLPAALLEKHVYSETDFKNEAGIVPSFWTQKQSCTNGNCLDVWGPCYPPTDQVDWDTVMMEKTDKLEYSTSKKMFQEGTFDNYCRPGFLIIGQGKCGTSSLYHYLVGHPRVLAASEKQIHYFKYYARYGLKWYMSHFPTAQSFFANGALMTGEASPGYLPYPDVVALTAKEMSGTKIICVGRDPMARSFSSYRYNYVNPAIEIMKKGKAPGILKNKSDEYYHQYLHTFEDMIKAELKLLKECLAPGGPGEQGARGKWGTTKEWGKKVYEKRKAKGLPPLVDIDGHCYGDFISKTVPRKQWQELVDEKPNKFLNVPSIHLSQAMIGRSLYVYPLEWWYSMFPEEDIYFLCTEEMRDMTGAPLNKVGQFLGLPSFNFSEIVSEGAYNVGGHKGYDKVTSWETVEEEHQEEPREQQHSDTVDEEIPLSDELRAELLAFFKIHNDRLIKVVERTCKWS